ncbi:MAG: hypothetical protein R3300_08660 [Candidatus Promineifilaceae bacterium]|nr:hypothetical protein [Candidatus Promineifilaceae bacterium]
MPTLTRWYIKTALLYLAASLVVGVVLAGARLGAWPAAGAGLSPVYFHLFMVGWVSQLIFGVIYWLFPRHSRQQPRGRSELGWSVFGLLNAGLLLRAVAEPLNATSPRSMWGWLLVISAVLQWAAGLLFVIQTWPRVHGGPRRRSSKS